MKPTENDLQLVGGKISVFGDGSSPFKSDAASNVSGMVRCVSYCPTPLALSTTEMIPDVNLLSSLRWVLGGWDCCGCCC